MLIGLFLSGGARTGRPPDELARGRFQHLEPSADNPFQLVAFEPVDGAAAVTAHTDDACSCEDVEVPGGGGPTVVEALGEISRGQLGAAAACGDAFGGQPAPALLHSLLQSPARRS